MASIMDILKIKPFVEVSVGQLLWGYEDPLLKLAKDVVPKEQKLPYEEFGLFYGKNGTSPDVVTMFSGANDMTTYGIISHYNMREKLQHWTSDQCNSIAGSDGSIFPPHITKNDTLAVYDKDLCRLLPLKFLEEVSLDDSPIMLSFPHFYLAEPSLREAVEGISPPIPEKHRLFIDVQPGIDELPEQVRSLLRLATQVPPLARSALGWGLSALGLLLILLAVTCLIRSSHRQSTLRLEGHVVAKPPPAKTPSKDNGYELNSRR
ncbi:hypothetical protein HF086_007650 [Spodoptera exigua]|uniref:Scavenger receptor class B member 1 n=1 Tax=Spodoptera exigua TaxID=7107 RepID=A0A922SCS7_SPOEX|nr:hypothetical protein HF086_007650 [Spodoptera exigua]